MNDYSLANFTVAKSEGERGEGLCCAVIHIQADGMGWKEKRKKLGNDREKNNNF